MYSCVLKLVSCKQVITSLSIFRSGFYFQISAINSAYEIYCIYQLIKTLKKSISFPRPLKSQYPRGYLPYPHGHMLPLPRPRSPLSPASSHPLLFTCLREGWAVSVVLKMWYPNLESCEKANSLALPQAYRVGNPGLGLARRCFNSRPGDSSAHARLRTVVLWQGTQLAIYSCQGMLEY